jgi:hypothetical protein
MCASGLVPRRFLTPSSLLGGTCIILLRAWADDPSFMEQAPCATSSWVSQQSQKMVLTIAAFFESSPLCRSGGSKADGTPLKYWAHVLFQVITNRSRTEGRLLSTNIPLPPHLVDQAPELTAELREYLRNRPEVAVGKEAPKVYLSSLGSASSGNGPLAPEITLTCHTNIMVSLVQLAEM